LLYDGKFLNVKIIIVTNKNERNQIIPVMAATAAALLYVRKHVFPLLLDLMVLQWDLLFCTQVPFTGSQEPMTNADQNKIQHNQNTKGQKEE
jgi:hypothetical protein